MNESDIGRQNRLATEPDDEGRAKEPELKPLALPAVAAAARYQSAGLVESMRLTEGMAATMGKRRWH